MRIIRTTLVIVAMALAVGVASAQTGGIRVAVTDADGMPLPGATVTISNSTGYVKETAELTNADGVVNFPVLRAGTGYAVRVSFPGFSDIRRDGLRVGIGGTVELPVQMIADIQESVKVVATREVVDLEKTEVSTRFSDDFIADLPVPGRFYQNVLTMAPGVQDEDGDGNPNVHGSRARDFKAMVGGVSNVDPLTGQWMSQVNPNSIEEMEVITAGAGVEFGRAQGGFANIIQKQGSNEHEGVFEFYYRTSKLDGGGANDDNEVQQQSFDWIQPAFQFSGPVVRDKLWYRLSHEYRKQELPVNTSRAVEVTTIESGTHSDQLTWQISPRNKLAFNFDADPWEATNWGISSRVTPESSSMITRETQNFRLTWTAPYSPKILVESVVGYQDLNRTTQASSPGRDNACFTGDSKFATGARCTDVTNGVITGSFPNNSDDHSQRLTVQGRSTIYAGRWIGMDHELRFGFAVENERYFRELDVGPDATLQTVGSGGGGSMTCSQSGNPCVTSEDCTGGPNDLCGPSPADQGIASFTVSVPRFDQVRATGTNWGFYAQDQFKPRQNLTFTIGARLDREEIRSEGHEQFDPKAEYQEYRRLLDQGADTPANLRAQIFTGWEELDLFFESVSAQLCAGLTGTEFNNCKASAEGSIRSANQTAGTLFNVRRSDSINLENTNISPYLSVAWSPWSNGKTAFRGAVGRHYNNIPLILPLFELNPAFTRIQTTVSIANPEINTGSEDLGSIPAVPNVTVIDRGLRTPYVDEWTVAVERELFTETSISLRYINRQYKDQIQDQDINLDVSDAGRCVKTTNSSAATVVAAPNPSGPVWRRDAYCVPNPQANPCINEATKTNECTCEYLDDDPGIGDGRLTTYPGLGLKNWDDCVGTLVTLEPSTQQPPQIGGETAQQVARPDSQADRYVQNPFWGGIFEIGNINESQYEAFVFELIRRQYRSWEMQASYTYSISEGDGEDFFQQTGDDPALQENTFGFQSQDQRHVVKLNGTTITPWGIRLGTSISWSSGLPWSVLWQQFTFDAWDRTVGAPDRSQVPRQAFPTGVRNDQRNVDYWNVDLKATKELNLGRGMNLQLSAEVFNVFNDGTYRIYNRFSEIGQQVNGVNEADVRFGREWQIGMKLAF